VSENAGPVYRVTSRAEAESVANELLSAENYGPVVVRTRVEGGEHYASAETTHQGTGALILAPGASHSDSREAAVMLAVASLLRRFEVNVTLTP